MAVACLEGFFAYSNLRCLVRNYYWIDLSANGTVRSPADSSLLVLGMAGYFAAVSKAPLTGMILVTEMVGDLKPLMAIAVVTFVAYLVMDLLNGQPIYEAMLEKWLSNTQQI